MKNLDIEPKMMLAEWKVFKRSLCRDLGLPRYQEENPKGFITNVLRKGLSALFKEPAMATLNQQHAFAHTPKTAQAALTRRMRTVAQHILSNPEYHLNPTEYAQSVHTDVARIAEREYSVLAAHAHAIDSNMEYNKYADRASRWKSILKLCDEMQSLSDPEGDVYHQRELVFASTMNLNSIHHNILRSSDMLTAHAGIRRERNMALPASGAAVKEVSLLRQEIAEDMEDIIDVYLDAVKRSPEAVQNDSFREMLKDMGGILQKVKSMQVSEQLENSYQDVEVFVSSVGKRSANEGKYLPK